MTRKKCSKCRRRRLIKFFTVDRRRKSGLTPDCKTCRAAYQKAHYAKPENRARRKAYAANYYLENRDEIREKTDKHRRENLERYAAWQKQYREEHPEYVEEHRRLMRQRYREQRGWA